MTEESYQDPKKTQDSGSATNPVTIYDAKERRFFPGISRRRDNRAWRRKLARRYALQLWEEGVEHYEHISRPDWKTRRKQLSRRGVRYKTFPQPEDVIVCSVEGVVRLPGELSVLVRTLDGWIATCPEDKRVGGTKDFGGRWSRSRDRADPDRYLKVKYPLIVVTTFLAYDGIEFDDSNPHNVKLEGISPKDARKYVETLMKG